jgi:hypothetical protein
MCWILLEMRNFVFFRGDSALSAAGISISISPFFPISLV